MIIDKKGYILGRLGAIMVEKIALGKQTRAENVRFLVRKQRVPKWLRRLVFHPLNPAYSVWKQLRQRKYAPQHDLDWLTSGFMEYVLGDSPYRLDTADFRGPDDERQLLAYVDNRLRLALGMPIVPALTPCRQFVDFQAQIKKQGDRYLLPLDGKQYALPRHPEAYAAFVHYGLDLLPQGVWQYLAGKDFVDCGAFMGDSATYLLKAKPRKIYGFEPTSRGYDLFLKTIQMNGLKEPVPVRKGVGEAISTAEITWQGSGSNIHDAGVGKRETILITTLDAECTQMNVGLIKMDIEGVEYAAMKGAMKTIERDRPVLLISIYHNGRDFFEIQPMIKALGKDYHFRFIDLSPGDNINEKILAAYPAELE